MRILSFLLILHISTIFSHAQLASTNNAIEQFLQKYSTNHSNSISSSKFEGFLNKLLENFVEVKGYEDHSHEGHSHEGHSHEGHSHEGHSHENHEDHAEFDHKCFAKKLKQLMNISSQIGSIDSDSLAQLSSILMMDLDNCFIETPIQNETNSTFTNLIKSEKESKFEID